MNSPEKGWQPPPVGAGPSKEAWEAAKREWYARIDGRPTVHARIIGFAEALEAYVAARVTEVIETYDTAMLAVARAHDAEKAALAQYAQKQVAEARAQERERCAAIVSVWAKTHAVSDTQLAKIMATVICDAAEKILADIRALSAEPQEQI